MASKTEPKITRRQVNNLRAESMRYATTLMSRLRMSILGKPAIEKCECGKEYELFPNQPTKLDTAQSNLLKFDIDKIYPGIVEEELDKVVSDAMTEEESAEYIIGIITDSDAVALAVRHDTDAGIKARDILNRLLPEGNVVSIKKAG